MVKKQPINSKSSNDYRNKFTTSQNFLEERAAYGSIVNNTQIENVNVGGFVLFAFWRLMQSATPHDTEEVQRLQNQRQKMKTNHKEDMRRMGNDFIESVERSRNMRIANDAVSHKNALHRAEEERIENAAADEQMARAQAEAIDNLVTRDKQMTSEVLEREKELLRKEKNAAFLAAFDASAFTDQLNEQRKSYAEKEQIMSAQTEHIKSALETEKIRIEEENAAAMRNLVDDAVRARAANEERLRAMREAAERLHQEEKAKWRAQISDMLLAMRDFLWSQELEQQWASRLSGLRNAHTPVHTLFMELQKDLHELTCRNGTGMTSFERAQIEASLYFIEYKNTMKIQLLMDELTEEIDVMMSTKNEMRLFKETRSDAFLNDIEEATGSVAHTATQMLSLIAEVDNHLKTEYELQLRAEIFENCTDAFDELTRKVDCIPTVVALKGFSFGGFMSGILRLQNNDEMRRLQQKREQMRRCQTDEVRQLLEEREHMLKKHDQEIRRMKEQFDESVERSRRKRMEHDETSHRNGDQDAEKDEQHIVRSSAQTGESLAVGRSDDVHTKNEILDSEHCKQRKEEEHQTERHAKSNNREELKTEFKTWSIRFEEAYTASMKKFVDETRRRAAEEERKEIREQVEKRIQEKNETWKSKTGEIVHAMQQFLLTQQFEQKWIDRLYELRSAHIPVNNLFIKLFVDQHYFTNSTVSDLKPVVRDRIEKTIQSIMYELEMEIGFMLTVKHDMSMWETFRPESAFLSDIEASAASVAEAASQVLSLIIEIDTHLKADYEHPLSAEIVSNCNRSYKNLCTQIYEIPTVEGLKKKYETEYL